MTRKTMLILFVMTLIIGLVAGCADRESTISTFEINTGGMSPKNHVFVNELLMQLRNRFQLMEIQLYVPRAAFPLYYGGSGVRELPLLILLPPHDEPATFYVDHGLKRIADEMISSGEIVPMYIATIPPDPARAIGGYFYGGSSYGAGNWDTLLGETLADYISKSWEIPSEDPGLRGIGGFWIGAYGAFRAALLNPGAYSSISVIDGPLDFDGPDGNSGLLDLMSYAVNTEQGGFTDNADMRDHFDSSSIYPVSRMLIGGAVAFSPHDTLLDYTLNPHTNASGESELQIIINDTTRGTEGYAIQDTVTFITRIVTEDSRNLDFHLPFDYTGQKYDLIWNLWLDDNLENLMTGGELDGVDMWIATSPETKYGFHEMTMSWINTLRNSGYSPTVVEYTGYNGYPATYDQYIGDLLRDMLKFHSENFKANSDDL